MAILDKLVERKDIVKYLDARMETLKWQLLTKNIVKIPEKKRQYVKKQIVGRIKELASLKGVINNHTEKELASEYWEETREWRESRK
jgi:hypothetical protein